ncbi:DUF3572 domain-containing protein [Phreatobacter oligotrophus]|jgi:hypothetical protein|uniref:Uncharacterized protein DUF3572 n=1 Tax=Phreatobacter oligotrophus TaxID=1122261 RepID=A0A2T4Z592_9HYPH|nr:DUF3572 domain-containing protein [Phreatobacter oligotrophus]MBX9989779.1 DUF3572 domain-containing protein [Phreatobacter oligotrophus]PTM57015.1 uncharacterized protein DUF3572 [Phreatobacter oligotrophus]
MTLRRPTSSTESAEAVAVQALGFLAGDDDQLQRFASLAGIDLGAIREAATQPGFLAAVMEHFMADESLLLAFAAHAGLKPEAVVRAAHQLGAGPWERDHA